MLTIIKERNSGKAKELLEIARKNNAIIVTQDKRAFAVKAHSYGYDDVEVIDYEDLDNDDYSIERPALIHNGDKMLDWLMDRFYGLKVIGFSATKEK